MTEKFALNKNCRVRFSDLLNLTQDIKKTVTFTDNLFKAMIFIDQLFERNVFFLQLLL